MLNIISNVMLYYGYTYVNLRKKCLYARFITKDSLSASYKYTYEGFHFIPRNTSPKLCRIMKQFFLTQPFSKCDNNAYTIGQTH